MDSKPDGNSSCGLAGGGTLSKRPLTATEITSRLVTADKPLSGSFRPQSFLLIPPAEIQAMKKEIKDCHAEMALMTEAMQRMEQEIVGLRKRLGGKSQAAVNFGGDPDWTQPRSLLPRGI